MEERDIKIEDKVVVTVEDALVLNGREVQGVKTTSCSDKYLITSGVLDRLLDTENKYRLLKISSDRMSELCKSYASSVGKSNASLTKELIDIIKSVSLSITDDSVKEKLDELINAYNSMTVPVDNTEEVTRLRQQLQTVESKLQIAEEKLQEEPDFRALGKKLNARSIEVRSGKRIRSQAVMLSLAIQGKTTNEIADVLAERGYGNSSAAISRALTVLQPEDKDRLRGIMDSCPDEFGGITAEEFEKWYAKKHNKALRSYKKKLITQRVKAEMEKEFSDAVVEDSSDDDCDEWGNRG